MTAVDRPDNGQDEGRVLVARCDNYREDLDRPCTGQLRYRWGMSQAACDTCGGWSGIAVADWTGVARAGAGEQREQVEALIRQYNTGKPSWSVAEFAVELLALLDRPAGEPCRVYSHAADGWHCAVQGDHQEHRNAAGTETW